MATLILNTVSITVSPERISYNGIRLKYQRLAEPAAENFASKFTATFKNMDDIHNKCTEQFIPMLRETAEVAARTFLGEKSSLLGSMRSAFAAIYTAEGYRSVSKTLLFAFGKGTHRSVR